MYLQGNSVVHDRLLAVSQAPGRPKALANACQGVLRQLRDINAIDVYSGRPTPRVQRPQLQLLRAGACTNLMHRVAGGVGAVPTCVRVAVVCRSVSNMHPESAQHDVCAKSAASR